MKNSRLVLGSVAIAALICCHFAIAAGITRERGVKGQSDVIRIKGLLNLGDDDKFRGPRHGSKTFVPATALAFGAKHE
jgi:hypothetical protein